MTGARTTVADSPDPDRPEPSRSEPSRLEPSRLEPSRPEPNPQEPSPQEPSPQLTRDRLLRAALDVVRSSGVAGATSRQIATAAGTNLQAITYHFGSKDDLVGQALVQAVRAWVEPARRSLRGLTDDPVGHLFSAVWQLQAGLGDALPLVPAYLEALALVPRREGFREQIRGLLGELRADLTASIEELKATGFLADWVDPPAMAALIVAAVDGTAIHLAVDPGAFDPDAVLGQVIPLLVSASTIAPR